MSGSISRAVILRARIGPYYDPRPLRKSRPIGSTISVYIEARDEITDELVPVLGNLAAIYWLPSTADFDSQAQPVSAVQEAPGLWRCDVPGMMIGTYTLLGNLLIDAADPDEPIREAVEIQFNIDSLGNIGVLKTGEIPWSAVQAAGAAAGASAGLAAGRSAGVVAGAEAGAAAIVDALDDLAAAASAAVADQLEDKASKASVEALGSLVDRKADAATTTLQLDGKATKMALQAVALRVEGKADVSTARALDQRVTDLERAGPVVPEVTALAIAKAFGAALPDFADGRNAYRYFFI